MSRKKKNRIIVRRPPNQPPAIVAQQSATLSTSHSGPLPTPRDLADYARSGETFPDRIMSMAEREQVHRHTTEAEVVAIERHHVEQAHRRAAMGQWLGFVIAIAGMVVAGYMTHLEHPREAVAFGGADLAALVGVFMFSRKPPENEKTDETKKLK